MASRRRANAVSVIPRVNVTEADPRDEPNLEAQAPAMYVAQLLARLGDAFHTAIAYGGVL